MKQMKEFREKWRLSQQDMATMLCTSRELISMYENGNRSLPASSENLFALLLLEESKAHSKTFEKNSAVPSKQLCQRLKLTIREKQFKRNGIHSELEEMKSSFSGIQQHILMIGLLKQKITDKHSIHFMELDIAQRKLVQKLEKVSSFQQRMLQLELTLLETELAELVDIVNVAD